MTTSAQDYEEALAYLKMKLTLSKELREQWLNEIVNKWIARRKSFRKATRSKS